MSELIQKNDNRATIRWKLLTGASALALTTYFTSAGIAGAEDAGRPLLWVELGGQLEQVQGLSAPFTAPFMSIAPAPDVYDGISFTGNQRQARYSLGLDGKITFQPENSDWSFSAGIRYGRSHANRHTHRQATRDPIKWFVYYYSVPNTSFNKTFPAYLADTQSLNSERHTILDFAAGKDVGLGMFGRQGSSTLSAGIRFASFKANSSVEASGRPGMNIHYSHRSIYSGIIAFDAPFATFYQYTMVAQASRSFKGIGPSLSWSASAALAGNPQDGEITLDWGINAALLFGKQKAKTEHVTQAYHMGGDKYVHTYAVTYHNAPPTSIRSRSVTVPNIGGFAGLSYRYSDAKISLGYRYDTFLNAMDTGIDARKASNLTFNGPYASISIGLGD